MYLIKICLNQFYYRLCFLPKWRIFYACCQKNIIFVALFAAQLFWLAFCYTINVHPWHGKKE